MAERINRLGVDKYTIKINDEGEIFLTTGINGSVTIDGSVNIGGDLVTGGNSVSLERQDLVIYDNLIELNKGETANGIRDTGDGNISGIKIWRGSRDDALVVFDENLDTIGPGAVSTPGAISFRVDDGLDSYVGIHTTSIATKPAEDMHLIVTGNGVVRIGGTGTYERNVWVYNADDEVTFSPDPYNTEDAEVALVTAKAVVDYVDGYHLNFFQHKIIKDDSRVEIFDSDVDGVGVNSRVEIAVDEDTSGIFSTFFGTRAEFGNLRLLADPGDTGVITSNGINSNIRLRGSGTGQVQIDGPQNFMLATDPADPPDEGVSVYSKTLGDGGTGLYFINEDGTQDEFVSRGKALLYSIIF